MTAVQASGMLICAGVWNIQLHPPLKSTTGNLKLEALNTKNKLLKEINMVDVWRKLHPSDKYFTFFSIHTTCILEWTTF